MNLTKEQSARLGKYIINANPFMWGVLQAKNKTGRLKELKQMGFLAIYSEGSNPIYSKINKDLLVELGIKGILEKIVIPRIQNSFSQETLRYFRDCWSTVCLFSRLYIYTVTGLGFCAFSRRFLLSYVAI